MPGTTLAERYHAARRDPELAVLEGLHALKHALRFEAALLDARTRDPDTLRALARELAPDVAERILELVDPVDPHQFDTLAPAAHPTGVIALARRPRLSLRALLEDPAPAPVVLLERPTHHGNIGAVVRVAAAAGAAGVLTTGRHDPWHPTSIRGGAGLQLALPVAGLDEAGLQAVLGSDRPVFALDPEGTPIAFSGPAERKTAWARAVLVFGSERTGVSPALLERADGRFRIPMRSGVSSLNLATAVAVALYYGPGRGGFGGLDADPDH